MLEDFEEFDSTAAFPDEVDLEETDAEFGSEEEPSRSLSKRNPAKRFMGMTPGQWFVISFELFLMVGIMGLFFMIITGRMALPL